ncbi:MAG: hypothetical protein ACLU6S_07195 [Clostridium sp.]|uniref:hypothetical protein n=1 Tax=Clostridium sp. TaxID=1506 RepID=UPI00399B0823
MENLCNKEILNKEIDLIQGCINRMAHNSFIVKGGLVSLITVILTLLPEDFNIRILCIVSILITICTWYLDGFFLKVEKLYRWKYEWVIAKRLNTTEYMYDLNPYNKKMWLPNKNGSNKKAPNILEVMFSTTLLPIYVPTIIVVIFVFINSYTNWI